MSRGTSAWRRMLAVLALLCLWALAGASAPAHSKATLSWADCGEADDVECATAVLPRDYDGGSSRVRIAVARVPAADEENRIGSLFFNFGGPGAPAAEYLEAFGRDLFPAALTDRFDIVAMDPRGVGQSTPSIDCRVNQETEGIYSSPFTTPFNLDVPSLLAKQRSYVDRCVDLNGAILRHVSTANVARDLDRIRAALGERKISFLGFSYGTFLGATYASLFPQHYRAMVLDGPVDATYYINRPLQSLAEQTAGFELGFSRFMQACARDQDACSGFGGEDPWAAFDELVERANANPLPAAGVPDHPEPVSGDDIITATLYDLYNKRYWGEIAAALADAERGDGSFIRALVDGFYARREDGTYDPFIDRYFTIGASEQRYPRKLRPYLERGDESWAEFPHFFSNSGYVEIHYGLIRAPRDRDAYAGPFRIRDSAETALVVNTTYDPATPYRGGLRLVRDLGNARMLTMRGDNHTAYSGNSPCIDAAVEAYLLTKELPAQGTTCRQEVPFERYVPEGANAQSLATVAVNELLRIRRR